MRYILILLFGLLCFGAEAQIQAKQLRGGSSVDSLYIMGTDTVTGSNTKGLGKWFTARALMELIGDKDWLELSTDSIPMNADSAYRTGYTLLQGLSGGFTTKIEMLKEGFIQFDKSDNGANRYDYFMRVKPLQQSEGNTNFNFTIGTTGQSGSRNNDVVNIGWNVAGGGSQVDASKAMMALSFENGYDPAGTNRYQELHLLHTDTSGNVRRPLTLFLDEGDESLWSAAFHVPEFEIRPPDDTDPFFEITNPSSGTVSQLKLQSPITNKGMAIYVDPNNNNVQLTNNGMTTPQLYMTQFWKTQVDRFRILSDDGTATTIVGRDGSGNVSTLATGYGLDITGGTLEVDTSELATQYDLTLISGGTDDQNLTLTGSGPTYTLDIEDGTDVIVSGGGIVTLSESPANTLVITGTEVDGSVSNELQTFGHSGTTSYTNTLSDGGGSFTLQAGGINTISHAGGTTTITATEVDGSTSNELQTVTNTSNASSHTLTLSDGGGSIKFIEGTDINFVSDNTDPNNGEITIEYGGAGGADGDGIYDGDGTTPSDTDISITDHVDFAGGLLYVDDATNRVGINTASPTADLHVEGSGSMRVEPTSAGSAASFYIQGKTDGGGGNVNEAEIGFSIEDADYNGGTAFTGATITMGKQSDLSQWSTLTIQMPEATDADIMVAEKQGAFSNNTTESHIAFNGGVAFTQNYEWTSTSGDLNIDRSYNIVNVSGSGTTSNEINLPEVTSTSDNWDSSLASDQVQVGQEFTISNFRSGTNLIIRVHSGDQVNAAGSTVTLNEHESVIIKCVRYSGGVGYWKTYN